MSSDTKEIVNGLLEREDWSTATKMPLGVMHADTRSSSYHSIDFDLIRTSIDYYKTELLLFNQPYATIKSHEFDKLLPYTINEVRLAAEENKPLTYQVEAALEKKHVICFLKYYDREYRGMMQRRYPLLKIYTEAELHEYNSAQQAFALAASISEDLTSLEHIGSSSSTPKAVVEKEFLTPKMKAVLEEVVAVPALAWSQADEQPTAKANVTFWTS